MKAGILALGREPLSRLGGLASLAEALALDDFWIADERFFREVYVCLAHCARHTRRIRLGPFVTDPYSRHPALTAMAIATLDELSAGRAVLGLGAGVSGFSELGLERRRPARALREGLEVISALLAGETVRYRGEIIGLDGAELGFAPWRPRVPTYVASNMPLTQRLAGALADGAVMEGCAHVEEVAAFRREVREGARSAGREPTQVELVTRLNACISKDGTAAHDALRPHVARTLGAGRMRFATLEASGIALPEAAKESVRGLGYIPGVEPYLHLLPLIPDHFVDALSLAGTVEEVTARIIDLNRAGIDRFAIHPLPDPEGTIEDTIRAFAESVVPAARRALA